VPLHRRAAAATGRGVSGDLASAAAFLRRWGELVTDEEVIQPGPAFWLPGDLGFLTTPNSEAH